MHVLSIHSSPFFWQWRWSSMTIYTSSFLSLINIRCIGVVVPICDVLIMFFIYSLL